jgi:hypothetical protein
MGDDSRRRFSPFGWLRGAQNTDKTEKVEQAPNMRRVGASRSFAKVAGLENLFEDTKKIYEHKRQWTRTKYDDEFDLYDDMLRLDPELNGAVRSVSLTANNWEVDYKQAKNRSIRNAIKELVEETLDFDDLLINMLRSLMVYGNDITKFVGRTGVGITSVQSLPVSQITIRDDRGIEPPAVSRDNPIMKATHYLFRENETYPQTFAAKEIWHIKMDYRSNWFQDRLGRWTYGVWGASRFSSLKQPIRAKYNAINNRIALEDALTKQYITIDMEAVEHITDPDEQRERLAYIMGEVGELLEGLRGDQIPILPSYVQIHHVDLKNTVPDNSQFLDMVNADISAVLQVPRAASGQERGSTFAATYSASMWSINAIRRLQGIAEQACQQLFLKHLELLGISANRQDLPRLEFSPIEEEGHSEKIKRATMGYTQGVMTRNESRDILRLPPTKEEGDDFKSEKPIGGVKPPNRNPRKGEPKGPKVDKGGNNDE